MRGHDNPMGHCAKGNSQSDPRPIAGNIDNPPPANAREETEKMGGPVVSISPLSFGRARRVVVCEDGRLHRVYATSAVGSNGWRKVPEHR